jgi:uncharacterized protein
MFRSSFRRLRQVVLMGFVVVALVPAVIFAEEKKPRVLLVTESKGFVHKPVNRIDGALAPSEVAMRQLSLDSNAFLLELSQDSASAITRENLERFDVVMFYTTGKLPISEENIDYFATHWLKQPKHGFIGIHSATDTLKDDARYVEIAGGNFNGHPWTQNTKVAITVHEPTHPTIAAFGKEILMQEEIYQYNRWVPENVRVLMSLDMSRSEVKRPYHVPVAWVRSWGEGRIFVNNMGHREDTWTNKQFLDSMIASIHWAAGLTDGPTQVNPDVSKQQDEKAKADCLAVGITEAIIAAEEAEKARKKAEQDSKKKAAAAK